jgi:leucyl aminopeptidase (aminopeptidase T)
VKKSSSIRPPQRRDSVTISFEAREYLLTQVDDPSLTPGARNAVSHSLGLTNGQTMVLVVESGYERVGAALLRAAESAGAEVVAFIVKDEQTRNEPFVTRLAGRLAEAQASAFVGSLAGLPRAFHRRLVTAGGLTRRHADMAGINEAMMVQSMRTDPREIDALGRRLLDALSDRTELRVLSSLGTDLSIRCEPRFRWHNASGALAPGQWAPVPGGAVITTPASVDGVLIADGGIWMSETEEHPRSTKIRLRFEQGKLASAEGLEEGDALFDLLDADEHGRRVGRVSFGTNVGVLAPVNGLQDLRAPGLHLTLGRTVGELTGADWDSNIEVPLLPRRVDVAADGKPLLVRGRYVQALS